MFGLVSLGFSWDRLCGQLQVPGGTLLISRQDIGSSS